MNITKIPVVSTEHAPFTPDIVAFALSIYITLQEHSIYNAHFPRFES